MKTEKNTYLQLFISTFNLSAFTFGGGYVIISLMKKKFVEEFKWIEEDEMLNLAAIAQSSPGAVAVNASIILGYKVGGIKGAIISIVGTILPPLIIISIISMFYTAFRENSIVNAILKGMQAGVAAVICDVIISLTFNLVKGKDIISISVMILAFIATYVFNINVAYIILICGSIGLFRTLIENRKELK